MASNPTNANSNQNIPANTAYTLALTFQGDARYTVAEYVPDGSGGWNKSKDIQDDGDSTDAQHDSYNMTPVAAGQVTLVRIKANAEAVSSGGTVSVSATLTAGGTSSTPVTASGTYNSDTIQLAINLVVKGGNG